MRLPQFALTRRLFVGTAWAGGLVCATKGVWAAPASLPVAVSLPDELAHALKRGSPLVVMVSLDGCVFCKVTRENYLGPLQVQQGLPVVQVDMRSKQPVKNLAGADVTHDDLIRSWGIKVAPTVLFFGPAGAEVAPRLVGGMLPDFYGAYLDERIQQAKKRIAVQLP